MMLPDEDLEAIAEQNDKNFNVGTKGRQGRAGSMKRVFETRGAKLARLFSRAKAAETRRKNKRSLPSTMGTKT